jgi:hypothetical protein
MNRSPRLSPPSALISTKSAEGDEEKRKDHHERSFFHASEACSVREDDRAYRRPEEERQKILLGAGASVRMFCMLSMRCAIVLTRDKEV